MVAIKSKDSRLIQTGASSNYTPATSTYVLRIMNDIQPYLGIYIVDCTGRRTNIVTINAYPNVEITASATANNFVIKNNTHIIDCTLYKFDNSIVF